MVENLIIRRFNLTLIIALILLCMLINSAKAIAATNSALVVSDKNLAQSCSIYYKNALGEVYQLPINKYLPACKCSVSFVKLLTKSTMAGFMMSSDPSLNDAVTSEQRASCQKLINEFTQSISQGKNIGVKVQSSIDSTAPLMASKSIPSNELFTAFSLGSSSMYVLPDGMKSHLDGIAANSNKTSLFSLNALNRSFQDMADKEAIKAGKGTPAMEQREAEQYEKGLGQQKKELSKYKDDYNKTARLIYKDEIGELYQLPAEYEPAKTCTFMLSYAFTDAFNLLTQQERTSCYQLSDKFSQTIKTGAKPGTKLDETTEQSLYTLALSAEVPINEILVYSDKRGLTYLKGFQKQHLSNQTGNNGQSLVSLTWEADVMQHQEDMLYQGAGKATPEMLGRLQNNKAMNEVAPTKTPQLLEKEKKYQLLAQQNQNSELGAEKSKFRKICKVLYKKQDGSIYELPIDKYQPVCDCAFGVSMINQSGIIPQQTVMKYWNPDYNHAHMETDVVFPADWRNTCKSISQNFQAAIDKGKTLGKAMDTSTYPKIVNQISSPELPANMLFAVFGPTDTGKLRNTWIGSDAMHRGAVNTLTNQNQIQYKAVEAYSFISPIAAVQSVEAAEAENKNHDEMMSKLDQKIKNNKQ